MPERPEGFLGAVARVAVSFQNDGAGGRIWQELRPWLAQLALHAAPKWLPRIAVRLPCQIPVMQGGVVTGTCLHGAMAQCDSCGRMCCLDHARIDRYGDGTCYICCAEIKQIKDRMRAAGQPTDGAADVSGNNKEELAWARRKLGVNQDTSWADVQQAYRKQSAKWHPDRHRTPAKKRDAEAKFKDVQRAFELLKKVEEAA